MGFLEKIFGTHSQNELKRIYPIVDRIEAMDADMQKLTDDELRNKTREFKERLADGVGKKLSQEEDISEGTAVGQHTGAFQGVKFNAGHTDDQDDEARQTD